MSVRRVFYLTGTRADFGLMLPTLKEIHARAGLQVEVAITGMHLSPRFGLTATEVEQSGLPIVGRWPVEIDADDNGAMARCSAAVATAAAAYFSSNRPDLCLILGDRWEMLSTALCATLAGIPIVHLCGGDRSGSVDDAIRHAISKLAHVHCPATNGSRDRLLRMGETADRIHVVGGPGLVGLEALASIPREQWARQHGLDPALPIAAVLFHPVVQDAHDAGRQMSALLRAVRAENMQGLVLMPNADLGNSRIREAIDSECAAHPGLRAITHLPRDAYVSLVSGADVLVGNSSSGILEAASFGTPVVNVGNRQASRERNANTIDVAADESAIRAGLRQARLWPRSQRDNIYGDGKAHQYVADVLEQLPADQVLLNKDMSY